MTVPQTSGLEFNVTVPRTFDWLPQPIGPQPTRTAATIHRASVPGRTDMMLSLNWVRGIAVCGNQRRADSNRRSRSVQRNNLAAVDAGHRRDDAGLGVGDEAD